MATYDFHGEVRTPCPLCLRPYQSFKQFEFTFYFIFLLGLDNSQKIISADAKGEDSMILFKIKETAHINSGRVLFLSLGSHVMMALTQENVHYTLNSGPGEQVEQGSCADPGIFVRGGGTSRKQSGQCFF